MRSRYQTSIFAPVFDHLVTQKLIEKLKIVGIYPPYLFSVQYEGEDENEFDHLFVLWNDVSYLMSFLEEYKEYLTLPTWQRIKEPEDAARQILDEADNLEELFEELKLNAEEGRHPDFDDHFHFLNGKYQYEIRYIPVKSYGTNRPSLLRIYAIKLEKNCYLITGGGIKLADTIQNSPHLKEHVLQNIERVRSYLIKEGLLEASDLID